MANEKVWTPEQREAAADSFSGRMMQTQNVVDTVVLPCGDTVRVLRAGIEVECELSEAVELLKSPARIDPEYRAKRSEFLKRNEAL